MKIGLIGMFLIGSIMGLIISILPVSFCFRFIKNKPVSRYKGCFLGLVVWSMFLSVILAFDYFLQFFVFAQHSGKEDLTGVTMLLGTGFFTLFGFVLSGYIVAVIESKKEITP